VQLDPALPASIAELRVSNAPLGEARLALSVTDRGIELHGLPNGVEHVKVATRQPG
jgi:hypothetical protein